MGHGEITDPGNRVGRAGSVVTMPELTVAGWVPGRYRWAVDWVDHRGLWCQEWHCISRKPGTVRSAADGSSRAWTGK